jgi:hypothetical protein
MRRRLAVIAAMVAVLVASVTTAVAAGVTNDDPGGWGPGGAMMSTSWHDHSHGGHLQGCGSPQQGWNMRGMMHRNPMGSR